MRRLVAVIGEAALSAEDRTYLDFADRVEREFIGQGTTHRTIEESLDLAWRLLADIPETELRIDPHLVRRYAPRAGDAASPMKGED